MIKGKVIEWNDAKGFGYIAPIDGGKKVFFHISAYPRSAERPAPGVVVFYNVTRDVRGEKAIDLRLSRPRPADENLVPASPHNIVLAVFVVVLIALLVMGRVPLFALAVYGVLGVVTYVLYGWDKVSARTGKWRTEEQTLHMLSLLGGWPAALLAQQHFKHKTRKASFQATFWVTVVVNCMALAAVAYLGWETILNWLSSGAY